jgi:DNA-directed RNA polymerase subunit RPC12/RpoP
MRPYRCAICGRQLRDDTRVSLPGRPDICTSCYANEADEEE